MQIVIDIDEEELTEEEIAECIRIAEVNFSDVTILQKGHGELIDKDVVLDMMNHGILEEYITTMGGVIHADR